jgi:sporulation protein YlmC with PRC-barrel domain
VTRFSEAVGRKVVDLSTAQQLGEVESLVVDPEQRRVSLLRLRKTRGKGKLVDWQALRAFGDDAITVPGPDAVREPGEGEKAAASGDLDLSGRLALSDRGRALGRVLDVEFDPSSGEVLSIATDSQTFGADRLLGVGSYAAVIRAD